MRHAPRANAVQIGQMFVGYQLTIIDLPRFVEARRGRLEVDLLTDSSLLDGQPVSPFTISHAVRSWYSEALIRDELVEGFIHVARVRLDFDFDTTRRGDDVAMKVTLQCLTTVEADDGTWRGKSLKSELWERTGDSPWRVSDD
jgi:hypothetical protein